MRVLAAGVALATCAPAGAEDVHEALERALANAEAFLEGNPDPEAAKRLETVLDAFEAAYVAHREWIEAGFVQAREERERLEARIDAMDGGRRTVVGGAAAGEEALEEIRRRGRLRDAADEQLRRRLALIEERVRTLAREEAKGKPEQGCEVVLHRIRNFVDMALDVEGVTTCRRGRIAVRVYHDARMLGEMKARIEDRHFAGLVSGGRGVDTNALRIEYEIAEE